MRSKCKKRQYHYLVFAFVVVVLSCYITATCVAREAGMQLRSYCGAWFSIDYPAGFRVKPSLKSSSGQGYDSAFFVSPDGRVEFYVYSPQWSGKPIDAALNAKTERIVSKKVSVRKSSTITWTTITAKGGSYTRSLVDTIDDSTRLVFGIKYSSSKSYGKYKKSYLAFKKSLRQYAD